MRNLGKKVLSFVLAVMVFVLCLPFCPLAEQTSRFGRQILGSMNNSSLLVGAYDELVTGCSSAEKEIKLSNSINETDLATVFSAIFNDYPEFFWLSGGYSFNYIGYSDQIASVEPDYAFTKDKIASATASLKSISDLLLEGLEGKSDYEKSLIIHDRLCEHITYKSTDNDQTAYGAIVEGEAVCAGYARAYQYLLSRVGIESWSIRGQSINPTTKQKEGHRWNMVKIDGKWYYTDVTWDDQSVNTYHNYFNRTLSYFSESHFPETFGEYLPDDNSTDADYFKKNNLVFKSVEVKKIVNLLKKSENTASFYVEGDLNAFLKKLSGKMEDIVIALGATGGTTYTYSTTCLGNEVVLTVFLEHEGHKHSPKKVKGTAPTCFKTGIKDYYKCSCGRMFADSSAKTEISSTESLVLERTEHHVSEDLHFDKTAHWNYCTDCGADIDGSSSLHTDKDGDLVCDLCGSQVEPLLLRTVDLNQIIDFLKEYAIYFGVGLAVIVTIILIPKRRR